MLSYACRMWSIIVSIVAGHAQYSIIIHEVLVDKLLFFSCRDAK